MASAGNAFSQQLWVEQPPDVVTGAFITGASGVAEYAVSAAGNSVILTRRFLPTWAIVVAVVGLFFFLLGLLALFYRETETLTIAIIPHGAGSQVQITGQATPEMTQRILAVTNSLTQGATASTAEAQAGSKTCPMCAEDVSVDAQFCPYCGNSLALPAA